MSDQTISGSPGSKQQSAGEAQGRCEETEFLHWQFLHLYISPLEEGDEEILLRGGERRAADQAATTKPLQAAVEQQLRGTSWETWAWASLLWWELYPKSPAACRPWGAHQFWAILSDVICTWMHISSLNILGVHAYSYAHS